MAMTDKQVSESEMNEMYIMLMDSKKSLRERADALLGLRHAKGPLAIEFIGKFLIGIHEGAHPSADALLQHEAAYGLGQRGDASAIKILENCIRDEKHSDIVRHESGEALAALVGKPGVDIGLVKGILADYTSCEIKEVAETCILGLKRLEHIESGSSDGISNPYPETIDPSPGFKDNEYTDESLRDILLDQKKSLFDRYRALFSLRNVIANSKSDRERTEKASLLLAEGLNAQNSALLRHEVAFVLGQIGDPVTADLLSQCLKNVNEHSMVRHEAAEALGTVLDNAKEKGLDKFGATAQNCLTKHLKDSSQIVRESCVLALNMT